MNTTAETITPALETPLQNTTSHDGPPHPSPLLPRREERESALPPNSMAVHPGPLSSDSRGNGQRDRLDQRIARLPKETRDMINVMLDDGLPYHVLIDELGEAGDGLNVQSLADWVQGRYQHYLKNRQNIEGIKCRMEFATDLLRELGDIDPDLLYRACRVVAALQILEAMLEHGDEALRKMLQVKPASYVNILNGVCNLSNSDLKQEEQRQRAKSNPVPRDEESR